MSQNCCDSSYYRTPYNVASQDLYCNLAQSADTNLQNVITSGYSYMKQTKKIPESVEVRENYCGCGSSRVYNDSPMAEYYASGKQSATSSGGGTCEGYGKDARRMMVMKAAARADGEGAGCPTDFYRTPYNIAYQQLYSGMAERANTNMFSFREDYASATGNVDKARVRPPQMVVRGPKNVDKVTYFYSR